MTAAALVWFRRDLRLADQPALAAALASGRPLLPVYIHAPHEEAPWAPGAASQAWLHHALLALDADLRRLGSGLLIRRGDSAVELDRLLAETGAVAVHWNRLYEPALIARDQRIKAALRGRGIVAESHNGALLAEPWELATGGGEPYRVFTPYWRKAQGLLETLPVPLPAPDRLPPLPSGLATLAVDELGLLPRAPRWDQALIGHWQPGESGAQAALALFAEAALAHYADGRDRPDLHGTSRLSPHLHFGEISPRQVVHALHGDDDLAARARAAPFVRELGWRDFAHQLLYHFPHTPEQPLYPQWQLFPWTPRGPAADAALAAWQRGRTGIPIIDAGLRELWATGWMHNRVRMLVASFLCKNLRLHWRHGADWFWDTLVDADLANNTLGWQWSAGCGADAAPYFRIFNPVSQGEKFDGRGDYVRRWVPELARLSGKAIHQPWLAGGVRGYPQPVVDLKESREAALAAFATFRGA